MCFRSRGTKAGLRESWTGPDCSQRVCPFGSSFDYIDTEDQEVETGFVGTLPAATINAKLVNGLHVPFDYNVEILVMANPASGAFPIQYKRDVDTVWSQPITVDDGTGTAALSSAATAYELRVKVNNVQKNTGVFIWFDSIANAAAGDKYFVNVTYNDGSDFTKADDNSAHQMVECSGRGICERSSGQCNCFNGYEGDNCGRTSCPNECSGHGVCQSLKRFAAEYGITYTGYDAEKEFGCLCDLGFRGQDCSMVECPSGADPMGGNGGAQGLDCSGRGVCDYSSGTCKCSKGFFGERCESISSLI